MRGRGTTVVQRRVADSVPLGGQGRSPGWLAHLPPSLLLGSAGLPRRIAIGASGSTAGPGTIHGGISGFGPLIGVADRPKRKTFSRKLQTSAFVDQTLWLCRDAG
jgi:hypothetical protein